MRLILLAPLALLACGPTDGDLPSLIPEDDLAAADDRELVAEVTNLRLNRAVGGVIVEAFGRAPGGGAWDAELMPAPADGAVYTLEFRARPVGAEVQGGSPILVAGTFLSDTDLRGVTTIRVVGASNSQSGAR